MPRCIRDVLKRVTVVLPIDIHKALKLRSVNHDITMNDQIIAAVQLYLSSITNSEVPPK